MWCGDGGSAIESFFLSVVISERKTKKRRDQGYIYIKRQVSMEEVE